MIRTAPRPDAIESLALTSEVQQRAARVGLVHGRLLCQRSPVVGLKATALAGCAVLIAGAVSGWSVLHQMPTLVISTDQRVVLTFVAGVFALVVTIATAGYVSARIWHARTIPAKGRVRAIVPGLFLTLVGIGGALVAVQPWSFPPTRLRLVTPLVIGEYLAQHQVARGLTVYNTTPNPVAYVETSSGTWVAATIPQSAAGAVDEEMPRSVGGATEAGVAREIGAEQQNALQTSTEWLWVTAVVMAVWTAMGAVAQRRRWHEAPWPAPVAIDTLTAMARLTRR